MDDQVNLGSLSLQDRAWTPDEIRKHSANWTLAGDVGLYNLLNEFSSNIISRTHEVENAVDSLVHQTKMTSAKINNVINDFHMLSNMQFVENRVYDEEIKEPIPEIKASTEKTKEQKEAEMLPKILKAIEYGLSVLETQFDHINVNEISDSEDEEDISSEGRTILEPKDPYEHRPLPYIIGSDEFMKCDYAGLKDLVQEELQSFSEESNVSETDETTSDEGEPLPLDDEPMFRKPADEMSRNINDTISSSESELFGSEEKEGNNLESDSSLDFKPKEAQPPAPESQPEKKPRPSSVSSLQAKLKLPQVLPVPKLEQKNEDLFANDDNSDDDSPFRKKTGLFATDNRFTEDEKDGDLFSGDLFKKSPKNDNKEAKSAANQPKIASKKPETEVIQERKKTGLFEADEDSDDDIFNTLIKTKKPAPTKANSAESQDSSDKADSLSTPSSAPSIKSVGNIFGLTSNSGTLFDDSDEDDLFASNKKTAKSKTFDLDIPEDNDDLFGKLSSKPKTQNKVSSKVTPPLFEDEKPVEKIQTISPSNPSLSSSVVKKKEISLFDDEDDDEDDLFSQKKHTPKLAQPVSKPKKEVSLFDDDDLDDDLFSQTKKVAEPAKKTKNEAPKFTEESKQSLRPEPIKREKEESPGLFGNEPSLFENKVEPLTVQKVESTSLFEEASGEKFKNKAEPSAVQKVESSSLLKEALGEKIKAEEKRPEKSKSLFDDTDEEESSKSSSVTDKVSKSSLFQNELAKALSKGMPKNHGLVKQKPESSLFEDSGDFDLFTPKSKVEEEAKESLVTEKEPQVKTESLKIKDELDGSVSSKEPQVKKEGLNIKDELDGSVSSKAPTVSEEAFDSQSGFENPVDNSNMLNSMNKGRARITAKRRKPTRQGRLAALEKSEDPASTPQPSTDSPSSPVLDNSADDLFSNKAKASPVKPALDHKAQEKQKMNLMSQLMAEVATSNVGAKSSQLTEDDEEEVDIFSEASKRDRSKSSFSFKTPEQNGITSVFPTDKAEDEEDPQKSDGLDDDFFTEPAFKNFRSSISKKEPPTFDFDDDEDDDLFSTIQTKAVAKGKPEGSNSNDLFEDDVDIFADVQKEKYEMFPSQIYEDDDDDDIFKSLSNTSKTSGTAKSNQTIKKVETQQVDAFKDPLSGLLGDD